jgi:hypothetical protein
VDGTVGGLVVARGDDGLVDAALVVAVAGAIALALSIPRAEVDDLDDTVGGLVVTRVDEGLVGVDLGVVDDAADLDGRGVLERLEVLGLDATRRFGSRR